MKWKREAPAGRPLAGTPAYPYVGSIPAYLTNSTLLVPTGTLIKLLT